MQYFVSRVFIVLLSLCLLGCVNTLDLKTFASYQINDAEVSKVYLVVDCFVVDDVSGENHKLNVDYNKTTCSQLSESVVQEMKNKTSVEVVPLVIATGLQVGQGKYIHTVDYETDTVNLPIYTGDSYVNTDTGKILGGIADGLGVVIYGWEHREKYVESLVKVSYSNLTLLGYDENSLVMFVLMDGVRVPTGKSVGQGVATTVLTLGMITSFEHSLTSGKAVLLDSKGVPVWGDALYAGHAVETEKEVLSFANDLFRYFPTKNPVKKRSR